MKYQHVRDGNYCCERCDGPFAKHKKMSSKRIKRKDKAKARKEIEKASNENR